METNKKDGRTMGGFRLAEKIGSGAMGSVFRATQASLGREVAVKVIESVARGEPLVLERFAREARAAAELDHPNVVQPIDFGEDGGALFFAMELMDGGSAGDRLARGERFTERETLDVGIAIARALEYAETRGIVHRDVKPDNILFSRHGTPKLADLGLILDLRCDDRLTVSGFAIGTPEYMSPEQARGERDLDGRSDVYSLGVTLWEMLAGRRPYEAPDALSVVLLHLSAPVPDVRQLAPEVSDRFARALTRMLAKRREDRFASARELREELEVCAGQRVAVEAARLSAKLAMPEIPAGSAPVPLPPAGKRRGGSPTWTVLVAWALGVIPALALSSALSRRAIVYGAPVELAGADAGLGAFERPSGATETALVARRAGWLARALGPGPWRVEGRIVPRDAGLVCVRVEGRVAVELAVRRVGPGRYEVAGRRVTGSPLTSPPSVAPASRGRWIGPPRTIELPELPFAVSAERGRASLEACGAPLGSVSLRGPARGVAFGVSGGAGAELRGLVVRFPAR